MIPPRVPLRVLSRTALSWTERHLTDSFGEFKILCFHPLEALVLAIRARQRAGPKVPSCSRRGMARQVPLIPRQRPAPTGYFRRNGHVGVGRCLTQTVRKAPQVETRTTSPTESFRACPPSRPSHLLGFAAYRACLPTAIDRVRVNEQYIFRRLSKEV